VHNCNRERDVMEAAEYRASHDLAVFGQGISISARWEPDGIFAYHSR
jgi:hypothetical protein